MNICFANQNISFFFIEYIYINIWFHVSCVRGIFPFLLAQSVGLIIAQSVGLMKNGNTSVFVSGSLGENRSVEIVQDHPENGVI